MKTLVQKSVVIVFLTSFIYMAYIYSFSYGLSDCQIIVTAPLIPAATTIRVTVINFLCPMPEPPLISSHSFQTPSAFGTPYLSMSFPVTRWNP